MSPILRLIEHGQSCWLDNLTRQMIEDGELRRRVAQEGLRGVTSNPEIFHQAMAHGDRYDEQIRQASAAGRPATEIYEELVIADIRSSCDILRPVYDQSKRTDGFASLEVSPHLAHDSSGSIAEAHRLFREVDRPNVFIKIPGTVEGVPAIEESLVQGININITLLFSIARYEAVVEAYLRALERRMEAGRSINNVTSVASFFLSRVDVLVDQLLGGRISAEASSAGREAAARLLGKVAIANAKLVYRSFKRLLASERWKDLARHGAQPQRLLWASTSTKNARYGDVMYVEPLIGPYTINTMTDKTIAAFADHGNMTDTIEQGAVEAQQAIEELGELGIDFGHVAAQLENEGIQKFIVAFESSLAALEVKRAKFARCEGV